LSTPKYIQVYSWPTADFCVDPSKAPNTNPVFNFCNLWSNNVTSWVWDFGDNSPVDTSSLEPVHSYSAAATNNEFYRYSICLTVKTKYGCSDTICKSVDLSPEFTFYIPNTFTPNDDATNDLFYGKSQGVKEYNIWIFDRWGNQIWDCHHTGKNTDWDGPGGEGLSSSCKWDGKPKKGGVDMNGGSGKVMEEDVYVWKVQLTDIFGKHHTYVGHVNIIR
jgi:gliding motility-associated-like protein